MTTVKSLFFYGVAYCILLVLVRGTLPSESSPTLSLVGIPLVAIAVIIARDLARRATSPRITPKTSSPAGFTENPVQFLSGQIRAAAAASDSYFENVIRARLKELLTTKVALETGMERDAAGRILSDPEQGPRLLHSEELYTVLYGALPEPFAITAMIERAVDMIGAWKG